MAPSPVDDLDSQLSSMSISPSKLPATKKLDPRSNASTKPINAAPKSSSIFLKKSFASLSAPKKKAANTNTLSTPTKKSSSNAPFDRNAFFSDTPLAVDDKSWNNNRKFFSEFGKQKLSPGKNASNPVVIDSPLKQNENVDPKTGIEFHQSGFKKYAKDDSPFKDPYSALNSNSRSRAGAKFLDSPDQYANEQKFVDNLLAKIGEDDDKKELKKLQEPIEEKDRKVKGLSVNLLDHQVHGLKFLRKRERDKVLHKGGLLCDDMGLGKTVQTIALIVKNKPDEDHLKDVDDLDNKDLKIYNENVPFKKFKATLVICPVSLITQWSQEIQKFAPHLKVLRYHGPTRTTNYKELINYDVIISSYETIRSEYEKNESPIYQGYWFRVVLDEAHTIKNKKSKISLAVYNVESLRRWCLTGTPIQNSMSELQSLFIFLRISKFANEYIWNSVISKAIKRGDAQQAFALLNEELKEIMLRRTKAILQSTNFHLPPKNIYKCQIEFTELEQQLYTDLKRHFVHSLENQFEEVANQSKDPSLKKSYEPGTLFNKLSPSKIGTASKPTNREKQKQSFSLCAVVYLLRLRQVCCHWRLLSDLSEDDLKDLNKSSIVTHQSSKGNVSPSKRDMDVSQELDDITNFMNTLTVKETKCEICFVEKVKGADKVCTKCTEKLESNKEYESSKVLKLIEILKKEPKRKTIVFSQFREMLVLMGPILKDHGISYVNYDGQMNLKQKDAALEQLRNNEDTTVLLCSLKSGALGLNLTVASQVVIFDPWWNPQVQAQAIDRVYRIGQTRSVDIYEFAIKDSVEEGILELQERKKNLAKAITDGDLTAKNKLFEKLSANDLIKLFGLGTRF